MKPIYLKITGIPYSKAKNRGDIEAPNRWSQAVIDQTAGLPKVRGACLAKITFLLPNNKFPEDFPYGPDLDNLLKRFLDALNETVFSEVPGNDSCVISLSVSKARVNSTSESGALLELLPVIAA